MQETIALSMALIALIYLGFKFIVKPKDHDCGNCGSSNAMDSKKQ
jgi:hypothetical protein